MQSELVSLSDAGFHALDREIVRRSGGDVFDEAGLLHVAGTHPAPFIVNGTFRLDRSVPPAETIRQARDHARRYGRVAGMATHGHDTDLEHALEADGWAREVELPGMVAVELVEAGQPGPGVELVPVRTDELRLALIDVLAQSFGPEEPWPSLWASVFVDMSTIGPSDTSAVLAMADGLPAAAAVAYALEPCGVVGMVGTVPGFGRRGLGELVTRHVSAAAQQHNGRPVVLQSSPMARPLYERLGFRAVTRYVLWTDGG